MQCRDQRQSYPFAALLDINAVVIERSLRDHYIVAVSSVSFLYIVLPILQMLSFTSASQARWCHVVLSQVRRPFDRIESETGARRPSLQVVIAATGRRRELGGKSPEEFTIDDATRQRCSELLLPKRSSR